MANAIVRVFTAARMAAIEAMAIVGGAVVGDNLILTRFNGTTFNAGNVRGPQGSQGIQGIQGIQGVKGDKGDQGIQGIQGPAGNTLSAWPIGSIFMNTTSTNPSILLGGGTWSRWGQGRVPVSQNSAETEFDVSEETGGAKTVTLTAAQSGNPVTNTVRQLNGGGYYFNVGSDADSTHRATLTGPSDASAAHPNLPPYIVVYMWKRTA